MKRLRIAIVGSSDGKEVMKWHSVVVGLVVVVVGALWRVVAVACSASVIASDAVP